MAALDQTDKKRIRKNKKEKESNKAKEKEKLTRQLLEPALGPSGAFSSPLP
jgi:hypothetical protein